MPTPTILPNPASHHLDLPGLRMHTVESGQEDGVPIILLHGFPEFWYSWRYQMPALAEGREGRETAENRPYML